MRERNSGGGMSEKQESGPLNASEETKLPYVKPAIAWEESIESEARLMSACAKTSLEGGACIGSPGDS